MKELRIQQARPILGELVNQARLVGEPLMILRYEKPAAVLVSVEWYERAVRALAESQAESVTTPGEES